MVSLFKRYRGMFEEVPSEAIVDSPGGTTSLDFMRLADTPEGAAIIKELGEEFQTHEKFNKVIFLDN